MPKIARNAAVALAPMTPPQMQEFLVGVLADVPVCMHSIEITDESGDSISCTLAYLEGKKRPYRVVHVVSHPTHDDIVTTNKFSSPQAARECYTLKAVDIATQLARDLPSEL